MRCARSTAITPAVTLDSTASMNARRVSSCVLRARSSLVCSSSRPVIRLKAVASVCTSSSVLVTGTRAEKSPASIRPAAVTSSPTGRTRRSASRSAVRIDKTDDDQRAEQQRGIEPQLVDSRALQQRLIVAQDSRLRRLICCRSCGSNTRAS